MLFCSAASAKTFSCRAFISSFWTCQNAASRQRGLVVSAGLHLISTALRMNTGFCLSFSCCSCSKRCGLFFVHHFRCRCLREKHVVNKRHRELTGPPRPAYPPGTDSEHVGDFPTPFASDPILSGGGSDPLLLWTILHEQCEALAAFG